MKQTTPPQSSRPPCPRGADHRLPPGTALRARQRWQLLRYAGEGRTLRWLSSHYAISVAEVRELLMRGGRLKKKKLTLLPPPSRSERAAVAR